MSSPNQLSQSLWHNVQCVGTTCPSSVPLQLSCQYKKLSTGLTLRAGGWGFPPATEHGPWLILWVNRHPIYLTIGNHHWKAVWLSDYSGGLAM